MNIYWCHEKDEYCGLYVKARTRGSAKEIYSAEVECDFIDVRTHLLKHGINEIVEEVIDIDSPLLKKYGLEYGEDEEQ